MIRRAGRLCAALAVALVSCSPRDDVVFDAVTVMLAGEPVRVTEGSGLATISLRLSAPPSRPALLAYRVSGIEAQDRCHVPDFKAESGRIQWAIGQVEAALRIWIGDDDLAETDERLVVSAQAVEGAVLVGPPERTIVILDDDRSALIDARAAHGLEPGAGRDQSARIQAALDEAAARGRGVVMVAPGDYDVTSVTLAPGATISGRGARWHRPRAAGNTVTLHLRYEGAADSAPGLVEGLGIDGRRDQQGEFRRGELAAADLVRVEGSPVRAGRVRAAIETVAMWSATGNGLALGTNVDATVCDLRGDSLWRDLVIMTGGGSRLRARAVHANASEATTGIAIVPDQPGHQGALRVDAELDDILLGTGDFELDVRDGSRIVVRGMTMAQPPFRLVAPNAIVRISDSVLQVGIATARHNHWHPHDVEVVGSTLVASEWLDEIGPAPEADRTVLAAEVVWDPTGPGIPPPGGERRLLFDRCRFEAAADIDSGDIVYGVYSAGPGGAVVVRGGTLGSRFAGWLAPGCVGCRVEP